ncbi:DUF4184 family protein [Streptomyces sp. NPDC098789]|uniref:DUF4184 family protein n=1 Tax=Streptomyces sp. NPDC098789 TaxID=3366098 RepID=UPI003815701A
MPYALAHPAAVLPFCRGRLAPSALVAGAMVPDWAERLPIPGAGLTSHQPLGAVTIDLVFGLLLLTLFHGLLKRPLLDLASARARARLVIPGSGLRWRSWADTGYVVLSVVIGATTHILWDGLTHGQFFCLGDCTQLVQDGSTVLGLLATGCFLALWWRRAPESVAPPGLTERARMTARAVLAGALVAPAVMTLLFPPRPLNGDFPAGGALLWWYATEMALAAIEVMCLAVMVYALVWRLSRNFSLAQDGRAG